jgi:3-hydroxyisobutyrate dehydrogenase-like beta-hydroxyacid dehydrogenase
MTTAPQSESPPLTFIGFGEAAQAMVAGLREAHPELPIHIHDIRLEGDDAAVLRARAEALGSQVHVPLADAVAAGTIVLSTVVAKAAVAVAEAAAPHLRPGTDLSMDSRS